MRRSRRRKAGAGEGLAHHAGGLGVFLPPAAGGTLAGAEPQEGGRAQERTEGDADRPARRDDGEEDPAHAVPREQGALRDDPQEGAAEDVEVPLAEDVGERGHPGPGEDGRDGRHGAPQREEAG